MQFQGKSNKITTVLIAGKLKFPDSQYNGFSTPTISLKYILFYLTMKG